MTKKDLSLLGKYLKDVISNKYNRCLSDEATRCSIAYDIKVFLEDNCMEWTSLNTHTPIEEVDKGVVFVVVDGEKFVV